MFTAEQKAALSAPLDKRHVSTRSQAGRSLSYVEGWHAIAEANRIFGFDGWSSETVDIKLVAERERTIGQQKRPGFGVSYIARVRITVFAGDRIVVREGVGSGHGIDTDLGLAHESAIKEAETDGRKRGLMMFGNQFGLALYDKTQANVADLGGMASERDAIEALTDPKPAQDTPAQERPSKPSAPPAKPASDWEARERAKVSAAAAENLLDGNSALIGLRTLYKALGSSTPLSRTEADYATWDKQRKQVWRQLTVADQQTVTKAVNKFDDALKAAKANAPSEVEAA